MVKTLGYMTSAFAKGCVENPGYVHSAQLWSRWMNGRANDAREEPGEEFRFPE